MKSDYFRPFRAALNHFTNRSLSKAGISIVCAYAMVSHADYRQIIEEDFWSQVYPTGGKTFYCQNEFSKPSPVLNVGHVYPVNWISEHLGCRSERTCMRTNPEYSVILSDMHNMVAVDSYHYFKIKSSIFGTLDTSQDTGECGMKKHLHLIDPADSVKGDVARIHFYMHQKYGLPLNSNFAFMKEWHRADPPDEQEKAKNERIKTIQGNDNPFISKPELVESLNF